MGGGKKRNKAQSVWERIVVIVYRTKELAPVAKQQATSYSMSCRGRGVGGGGGNMSAKREVCRAEKKNSQIVIE